MVSYDTKKNTWHCPCLKTKTSCPHKYIAKWHLFETSCELFRKVCTTDEMELHTTVEVDKDRHDETDFKDLPYPQKEVKKKWKV